MQRLAEDGALPPPFFSRSPPAACGRSGGLTRPRHRFPGRMAVPPGSSLPALRVRSSRGPTVRKAPRGAKSGWMKRATGFTCPDGVNTGIDSGLSPWSASAASPEIPPGPPSGRRSDQGSDHVRAGVDNKIGTCEILASACLSSGYVIPMCVRCGEPSRCAARSCAAPSTFCGDVNPHPLSGPSGLVSWPVGSSRRRSAAPRSCRSRRSPPPTARSGGARRGATRPGGSRSRAPALRPCRPSR